MKEHPAMASFNPEFWEIPTQSAYLESVSSERALWYETDEDRERRYAMKDFFQSVLPIVVDLMDDQLTPRQREILHLYYFCDKTQEDIAEMLALTQSTVSRHLFGTVRNGKKVGGAIPKLQKAVEKRDTGEIQGALNVLRSKFDEAHATAAA